MDNEADGVIVSPNSISAAENTPILGDGSDSLDPPKVALVPDRDITDVKELTSENAFKISEAIQSKKDEEERSCSRIKVMQKKIKALSTKVDGEKAKVSPKSSPKTCSTTGRANCTIPQPFSLATEKRALTRSLETEIVANKSPRKPKTTQPLNIGKKYQQNLTRKPLQTEIKKHSDEESSTSMTSEYPTAIASITASPRVRISRSKTIASAPVFKSMERAEKRKEFNSKLEEKQHALEAEKLQSEARTKEEIEAAIKQIRRSMLFKASPLPNFYHEEPRLKHERKEETPTHTNSPKLDRRRSCSNAVGLSKTRTRKANRYSLGVLKEDSHISELRV